MNYDEGILLIMFGYEYQKITPICLESIRKYSNIPVLIHTNIKKEHINNNIIKHKNVEIIYHNLNDDDNRIIKTNLTKYTKFKKTLYTDVDSIFLSDEFLKEFNDLNNFNIIVPEWKVFNLIKLNSLAKNGNLKWKEFIKTFNDNKINKVKNEMLIAGGICFFMKNKFTEMFFNEYHNRYLKSKVSQDMPSLNYVYLKYKSKIKLLNNHYYNNSNSKVIQSLHNSMYSNNQLSELNFTRTRMNHITGKWDYVTQGTKKLFTKPKIAIIYDVEGWAFYNRAHELKYNLSEFYEIDVIKHNKITNKNYDLILQFSYLVKYHKFIKNKIICGVSSHKKNINELNLNKYETVLLNDKLLYNNLNHSNKYYIPNGVNTTFFNGEPKTIKNKDSFNIAGIGSLKWSKHKGKDRISKICEILNKKGYKISNKSLFVEPKKNRLSLSEMKKFYKDIDLLIISSVSETGPNTLLEAMSMGVPVISNETGLAPKIIEDSFNGFLIDNYKNINDYVRKIEDIFNDFELYEQISINSISIIKEYDWSVISLKYKKMFDEFLSKKKEIKELPTPKEEVKPIETKKPIKVPKIEYKKTNNFNFKKNTSNNIFRIHKDIFKI